MTRYAIEETGVTKITYRGKTMTQVDFSPEKFAIVLIEEKLSKMSPERRELWLLQAEARLERE